MSCAIHFLYIIQKSLGVIMLVGREIELFFEQFEQKNLLKGNSTKLKWVS